MYVFIKNKNKYYRICIIVDKWLIINRIHNVKPDCYKTI